MKHLHVHVLLLKKLVFSSVNFLCMFLHVGLYIIYDTVLRNVTINHDKIKNDNKDKYNVEVR